MKHAMRPDGIELVLDPKQVAALRLSLAALALSPAAIVGLKTIPKTQLKYILIVGLIGSGIPAFLFTTAQQHISSSLAGILNALTPLFTLIIGSQFFHRTADKRQTAGILIGLAGAAALISINGLEKSESWPYALLIVIATASYGFSVNTVQSRLQEVKALHITAISLLMAGVPCGIYAISSGVPEVVSTHSLGIEALGYVTTLAILGTAGANMLYFWLTQQTNALFASSVTYLMPIVSVAWGLLDEELVTFGHVVCGLIILSGVYLVSLKKKSTVK